MANRRAKPKKALATAYRGRLTAAQAAAGVNAAIRNAGRLLADAKQLYSNGSFATAAALGVLAVEEAGKRRIIERILLAKSDKQRNQHWKEYTSHLAKNVGWVIPNLVAGGAQRLDDFRAVSDGSSHHPFVWDDFKHWGFYTECRGPSLWSEPHVDITGEIAAEVLGIADAVIRNGREVPEAQMSLYVEVMSPVWREHLEDADPVAIQMAMKSYLIECQKQGFIPNIDIDLDAFFASDE